MKREMSVAQAPGYVRVGRIGYTVLAWLFAVSVAVQVYLAGMAVFVGPTNWALHTNFVHAFELLPVLMLILAFVGRLPRALKWLPVGLWLLIMVQYLTAGLRFQADTRMVAALHPVTGLLLFVVAMLVARRALAVTRAATA